MTEECMNGWKRAETDGGVPYYINHATKQTEWDHPTMREIMRSIEDCNAIRYASYRTAAKTRILHRELSMQHVQVELIAGVFERHRLSVTENSVTLDASEIEDVLSDIYFAARKETNANFNVDLATKLGVNYILNVFDKKRVGNVLVFSAKVALTLISCSRLQDKYGYLYQQLADHNACLSRAALHTLLINICQITELLGECTAYGSHMIQSSIDTCFTDSQGGLGVSEVEFASWLMREPPLLIWITTLNRMQAAEHITHNIKCSSCKVTPVQGPRYSCLRCAGYHQCQACFLLGRTSSKHKLKHPVREYCIKTSNREVTKLIIELIRNKLRLCPTRTVMVDLEEPPPTTINVNSKGMDTVSLRSTVRRKVLNDPQKELQSIISHLEEENKQLQTELLEICGTRAERLQRHRATIESQLQRLKILKKYLFTQTTKEPPRNIMRMESTPMIRSANSRVTPLPLEFELSPIVCQGTIETRQLESEYGNEIFTSDMFEFSPTTMNASKSDQTDGSTRVESTYTSSKLGTVSEYSRIELCPLDSDFSLGLLGSASSKEDRYATKPVATSSSCGDSPPAVTHSPIGIPRDNTPSSLQRPDKHSQHSSLQNIQGDLNDILDRLQNMVANDCLLEEPFDTDSFGLKTGTERTENLFTELVEDVECRQEK